MGMTKADMAARLRALADRVERDEVSSMLVVHASGEGPQALTAAWDAKTVPALLGLADIVRVDLGIAFKQVLQAQALRERSPIVGVQ